MVEFGEFKVAKLIEQSQEELDFAVSEMQYQITKTSDKRLARDLYEITKMLWVVRDLQKQSLEFFHPWCLSENGR